MAPLPTHIPPGDNQNKLAGVDKVKGLLRNVPDPLVTPTTIFLIPWVSSLTLVIPFLVSKELNLCSRFWPDLLPPLMAQWPEEQVPKALPLTLVFSPPGMTCAVVISGKCIAKKAKT
jgi:hypothetical protein